MADDAIDAAKARDLLDVPRETGSSSSSGSSLEGRRRRGRHHEQRPASLFGRHRRADARSQPGHAGHYDCTLGIGSEPERRPSRSSTRRSLLARGGSDSVPAGRYAAGTLELSHATSVDVAESARRHGHSVASPAERERDRACPVRRESGLRARPAPGRSAPSGWSATIAASAPVADQIEPHGVPVRLALLEGGRVAQVADSLDLGRERLRARDRPRCVRLERARAQEGGRRTRAHLARRGRVRDRRAPELRHVPDEGGARDEVDGDGVLVTRDVEGRRLAVI